MNIGLNSPEVGSIVSRYRENPNLIGIDNAAPEITVKARLKLRERPELLLETLDSLMGTLSPLQQTYQEAIENIASALSLSGEKNTAELVRQIQDVTLAKEKVNIQENYLAGGKLLVPVLGIGGIGKGTIIKRSGFPKVANDVSRDRAMRPGEAEGDPYYYHKDLDSEATKEEAEKILGSKILADLLRKDSKTGKIRGRYITTVKAVEKALGEGKVALVEQGLEQIIELSEEGKKYFERLKVLPVCVLPPGSGIIPVAMRIAERTFGDPGHGELKGDNYFMDEQYLLSTMGALQLEETSRSGQLFTTGENPLGVAYIVNDVLDEAVNNFVNLISPSTV